MAEDWLIKVPVQNDDMAWRIVDDECIIVDPQGSQATVLNPVGTRIWELADGKRTIASIVDQILIEYRVERPRAEADAREFVDELIRRKLIRFDGDAPEGA